MIKEICSLLQFIDINLQGDSFQSDSILEYAEKTIKYRYDYFLISIHSIHLNVVYRDYLCAFRVRVHVILIMYGTLK
jgi:hypothetical protein